MIRRNNTLGDKLDVKVGDHQGSVLNPLFVIVPEAYSRECRSIVPWEMLHEDDLVIITDMQSTCGSAEPSSVSHIRSDWKKFRGHFPASFYTLNIFA